MLKREATSLVTFYGISPIHAGAGASTSVVDLPIQRERHTNWPHIQASAVKGAMRQHFRRYAETVVKDNKKANEFINYIFGYDGDNDNNKEVHKDTEDTSKIISNAGIISVSDAKLLAFPMRSNIAPFVHITSQAVLQRLQEDLSFCGKSINLPQFNITADQAKWLLTPSNINNNTKIILEDYVVEVVTPEQKLPEEISSYFNNDIKALLLVSEEVFDYCTSYCTEIQTQIKIDSKTGTAQDGALRYQELLPSDTLLYSVVYYSASAFETFFQADMVKKTVEENIKNYIQLGGDETLGRGICKISWHNFNESYGGNQ